MFPTNGSEIVGVTAVGGAELTGGVHGAACAGGGAEIAGGGIHADLLCAGEIEAGALDEVAKCDDGCHATPGANPCALRDSSLALTTP